MIHEHSSELLRRWQEGDESAAEVLFQRYFARLHALVQQRLPQQLGARLDAEDVVQSAFRCLFDGARAGRFVLKRSGDLWQLLAAITMNKLRHAHRRHSAAKRACALEELPLPWYEAGNEDRAWLGHEPTPEEAAMLADEVEALLRPLPAPARRIVELRLQGYTLDEIAEQVRLSQRTVRRTMEQVKRHLENRLHGGGEP